jgi:hypothetical protein
VNGRDLPELPLIERKIRLKSIMGSVDSRLRYVDHIAGSGSEFYRLACEQDLEGIVAKWKRGTYSSDPQRTSWLKIKNPTYSQAEGRGELFEKRNGRERRYVRVRRECWRKGECPDDGESSLTGYVSDWPLVRIGARNIPDKLVRSCPKYRGLPDLF